MVNHNLKHYTLSYAENWQENQTHVIVDIPTNRNIFSYSGSYSEVTGRLYQVFNMTMTSIYQNTCFLLGFDSKDVPLLSGVKIDTYQKLITVSAPEHLDASEGRHPVISDAVSEALRLNDERATWAADREVWVRHGSAFRGSSGPPRKRRARRKR
jgi:hypothetical protein